MKSRYGSSVVRHGSPSKLLAHLMEQRRLSQKELTRMRELLKKSTKRK